MTGEAYTSTVVAPVQTAVGAAFALVVGVFLLAVGVSLWLVAAAVVLLLATGVYVSTVRLAIGAGRVLVGLGPWGVRARTFSVDDVVDAETANLGWAEVFGIGLPVHWRTTRLTVRPGPTLCLALRDNEHLRISTADPEGARALLTGEHDGATTMTGETNRPWFGPKRVGFGLRPLTWQGWAICLAPAVVVIVAAYLFG